MINPLDHPGKGFVMDLVNPNPTSSKTKDGPKYRVSFEVQQELWQLFMDADTSGMLIAAKATVYTDEPEEPAPKPRGIAQNSGGYVASELHKSGFFINPRVVSALGTDDDYQDWVRQRPCVVCGDYDWVDGVGRCEYAHVRRADNAGTGIKPAYSGVPLCHKDHALQHQHGESAAHNRYKETMGKVPGDSSAGSDDGKLWFSRMANKCLSEWAHRKFVAALGHTSLTECDPQEIVVWAEARNLLHMVPRKVRNAAENMPESLKSQDE